MNEYTMSQLVTATNADKPAWRIFSSRWSHCWLYKGRCSLW